MDYKSTKNLKKKLFKKVKKLDCAEKCTEKQKKQAL